MKTNHNVLTKLKNAGELAAHCVLQMFGFGLSHLATGEVKHLLTVNKHNINHITTYQQQAKLQCGHRYTILYTNTYISTAQVSVQYNTHLRSLSIIMLFWQRDSLVLLAPTMSDINEGQFLGHSYFKIYKCHQDLAMHAKLLQYFFCQMMLK